MSMTLSCLSLFISWNHETEKATNLVEIINYFMLDASCVFLWGRVGHSVSLYFTGSNPRDISNRVGGLSSSYFCFLVHTYCIRAASRVRQGLNALPSSGTNCTLILYVFNHNQEVHLFLVLSYFSGYCLGCYSTCEASLSYSLWTGESPLCMQTWTDISWKHAAS